MRVLFTVILCVFFSVSSFSAPSGSGSSSSVSSAKIAVSIYPNPAHNNLFVSWGNSDVKAHITLYDATGTVVSGYDVDDIQSNLVKINTSDLQPGVYFVSVTIGDDSVTERVIIS